MNTKPCIYKFCGFSYSRFRTILHEYSIKRKYKLLVFMKACMQELYRFAIAKIEEEATLSKSDSDL